MRTCVARPQKRVAATGGMFRCLCRFPSPQGHISVRPSNARNYAGPKRASFRKVPATLTKAQVGGTSRDPIENSGLSAVCGRPGSGVRSLSITGDLNRRIVSRFEADGKSFVARGRGGNELHSRLFGRRSEAKMPRLAGCAGSPKPTCLSLQFGEMQGDDRAVLSQQKALKSQ
jgi:hypothetical protein